MKTFDRLMIKMDWGLLQKQKQALINLLNQTGKGEETENLLWGIVFLIDSLQDIAEAIGWWHYHERSAKP